MSWPQQTNQIKQNKATESLSFIIFTAFLGKYSCYHNWYPVFSLAGILKHDSASQFELTLTSFATCVSSL